MALIQQLQLLDGCLQMIKNKMIDPKNPNTVGKSLANLGNHILIICFVTTIVWVIWMSYK
jgi:hypothetical protein